MIETSIKIDIDFFNENGLIHVTGDGEVWRYMPLWFKEIDKEGNCEPFLPYQLPDYVVGMSQPIFTVDPNQNKISALIGGLLNLKSMNALDKYKDIYKGEIKRLIELLS